MIKVLNFFTFLGILFSLYLFGFQSKKKDDTISTLQSKTVILEERLATLEEENADLKVDINKLKKETK